MSEDTITIDKSKFWKYATLVLIVVIAIVFFVKSNSSDSGGSDNGTIDSNAQKVVISYKNYNYYPNTIRVKMGLPVSITLDSSVSGCFRSFVIPDFGVDELSSSPSDTINFTPDKKGSFTFRCGMGMGTGTLIVE
ncbi:MAG: cupredoxin domain-containing protein [Nanoarchaeota archaeon]